MRKKRTTKEFIEMAIRIHGDKYDYTKTVYISAKANVKIICPEHGEFLQTPDAHLHGKGCPKCFGKVFCKEDVIYKFKKVHGNKYDYSKVEYKNANTQVCIICPKHGEFMQTPHTHLRGHECPKCGVEKNIQSRTLTTEQFISNVRKRHGERYDYSQVEYVNSHIKVKVICKHKDINGNEHGEFSITPSNLMTGYGCPKCADEQTSIRMRLPYDEFQSKINELYGEELYVVDKITYENKPYEFNVFCKRHNITFTSDGSKLLYYKSKNCPECQKELTAEVSIKTYRDIGPVEKCEQPIMDEKLLNRIKSGEEVWVPVKGYENDYMVSSNGTVKRINRFSKTGRRLPDLLMQQHIDSRSGRRVDVSLKGSSKSLHKIVFESFYNITVSKGYEYTIDHIDTNPLNNSILNLRLCNGIRDNMLNNPLTRLHKCQQQGHNQKLITDCTDLENEIWKPCIGYEGLYLISNKGRIKAEERIIIEKNTNIVRRKKSHLMRLHNKDNMYYTIGLIDKHGKHKNHYVHKLEFESFYGKVKEGNEIDHIDSNSLNNNLENLRECSHKENCANVNSIIKRKFSLKNNNKTVVGINLLLVDENNYVLKEFVSYKDAALYFNVHHSAIERYINKRTKRLKCLPDKMNLIRKEQNGVINA